MRKTAHYLFLFLFLLFVACIVTFGLSGVFLYLIILVLWELFCRLLEF